VKSSRCLRSLALLASLLLTACASGGRVTEVVDAGCDWTRPVLVSRFDVLTDGTARQILAHNETWALRCGKED
jgi:hypothetical protein